MKRLLRGFILIILAAVLVAGGFELQTYLREGAEGTQKAATEIFERKRAEYKLEAIEFEGPRHRKLDVISNEFKWETADGKHAILVLVQYFPYWTESWVITPEK